MKRARYKHSILFGDGTLEDGKFVGIDTYEAWHLIPSSRPTIAMPGIETKYVTIPGRDGSLDLSEFLRKDRPAYGDRSGSFEFVVENDFDVDARDEEFWMTIYPNIVNALHGKKFKMVLREDDPDYYWEGRFTVDKYEPGDGYHSTVTISYAISPYKRRIRKYSEGMVWDNFNFEKDHDYSPWNLGNITGNYTCNIWGDGYPFQIEAKVPNKTTTFRIDSTDYSVQNEGHQSLDITAGTKTLITYANPIHVTIRAADNPVNVTLAGVVHALEADESFEAELSANTTTTLIVQNGGGTGTARVNATFFGIASTVTVRFNGDTKQAKSGETVYVGHAKYGDNQLRVTGGSVQIDWRGGSL